MSALCCSSLPHPQNVPASGRTEKPSIKGQTETPRSSPTDPDKIASVTPVRVTQLEYGVEDVPAPHLCFLFGLQQLFLSISSTITVPLVVSVNICIGDLYLEKSKLMSTFLFMCGVCTVMQCLLGVRLPLLQGGCHKFLPAIAALMSLETWKCPDMNPYLSANSTLDAGQVWKPRIREIQGGIMVASLFQILIGATGLLGVLLQYIGPITVVPTVSLVGLSLIDVAMTFCQAHWGISALTVALLFVFSLYLRNINVPFPAYTRKTGWYIHRYPLFKLMPVILAVIISWALCALLTVFDVAPPTLRTDAKSMVLQSADWFFFPYPGQWGVPTVSVAGVVAMLAVTISSVIESVGVFYACARISEQPPPPAHAVNRGIAVEGVGSLISGALGSGGATTSYSQNVGAIGFTRVASRSAFYVAGAIFLLGGIVGKVGAFLTTMPDPVLGGIVLVSFGMVTSVGLSTLSFVDLSSSRNMTIIGTSLLIGLMIPRYLEAHPGAIKTGDSDLDRVLTVMLGTSMFVGGVLAFILDNTVPGTTEERGIEKWRSEVEFTQGTPLPDTTEHEKRPLPEADTEGPVVVSVGDTRSDIGFDGPHNHSQHASSDSDSAAVPGVDECTVTDTATSQDTGCSPSRQKVRSIYDIPLITPYLRKMKCARYLPFLPSFSPKTLSLRCCQGRHRCGKC